MEIGNKIKTLRKQRGLTQEQLAESIGVSFQAVSKWENNISLPDISLVPILANFFGVTLDELFDFSIEKVRKEVMNIAQNSVKYREKNQDEGIKIIEEGLKKFPDNDILLENLLYLIDYTKTPNKTISIALKLIDITNDNSIRYDAFRFLAYAYKAQNDMSNAHAALEQIPNIYFSKLSEMAYLLTGEEKMQAAQMQKGVSLGQLLEMMAHIAECHIDNNDKQEALKEYEACLKILNVLDVANDKCWTSYRDFFHNKIQQLKLS